ncbi:hypothetical protein RND81_14G139100 [Saponaria officinalis]|uniref:Uncharacterized protein n=1 Tax=Saponaria officinalis TaxID=3572 RepID=A0AAW1GMX7_SAPOF
MSLCSVDDRVKQAILPDTNFIVGTLPFKYLGLSLTGSHLKSCQYQPLEDKFARKIHHWSSTHLSHAGKLRLIDFILYSNLVYWCSVFKLPLGVVHKLEACSRNFYWGESELGLGIHWMQWAYFTKLGVKGNSIWAVQARTTSPWVWSDVLKIRDDFLRMCGKSDDVHRLIMSWSIPGTQKFRLGAAYDFLRMSVPCAKKLMVRWEPFAPPKYCNNPNLRNIEICIKM